MEIEWVFIIATQRLPLSLTPAPPFPNHEEPRTKLIITQTSKSANNPAACLPSQLNHHDIIPGHNSENLDPTRKNSQKTPNPTRATIISSLLPVT